MGIALAAVFAMLAALHVYWALGGRWGSGFAVPTIGGTRQIDPGPLATLLVAIALLAAMLTILGQTGLLGEAIPNWIFYWGTLGISVVFLLRSVGDFKLFGFFKQIQGTAFARWDTWLYSPLCLLISITAFLVARRSRG
ncbi:MAG: DUF3995 domain-containing protein [Blastocatellia bacterium]